MSKETQTMERRRFVKLVALSGAAILSAPLHGAAAAPARSAVPRAAGAHRAPTAAMRKEIANQERSMADMIRTIRAYELPPGSPMGFVFRPLRPLRGK